MAVIKTVLVPNIGDAHDVDVIEISVSVGDNIEADDTLITLESEKASMDIPSPYSGIIKSLDIKVGDKVSQGSQVLTMEVAGESDLESASKEEVIDESQKEEQVKKAESTEPAKVIESDSEKAQLDTNADTYASPVVRRVAREFDIDLNQINGTGRKGRITKEDLQSYVKSRIAQGGGSGLSVIDMPDIDFSKFGEVETKPLSRIKKYSAANLHRNWVSIPHVTQFDEADITEMENFRQAHKAHAEKEGFKLTPLVFLLKVAAKCLQKFPDFNASLSKDGQNLILKKYINIGVAVDTPDGLVVPVVKNVDQKGLFELAKELVELSKKAREKKLMPDDMAGSCFAISSLGGIGGTAFTPIINAPDVAILGVSKSQMKPIYKDGEFEARLMLPLSLSYDHRVIDGAAAARFITHFSKLLGEISLLLL